LKIDGAEFARGGAVALGQTQELRMQFHKPFGGQDVSRTLVTVGGYHAIGLDIQSIGAERMADKRTEGEALSEALSANPSAVVATDDTIGVLLDSMIISFWAEGDAIENLLSRLFGVLSFRPTPGAGVASFPTAVTSLFGVPTMVRLAGSISLDVRRSVRAVHAIDGDRGRFAAFVRVTGAMRSFLEASVFEQMLGTGAPPAISTMEVLRAANEQGIRVFTIDRTNQAVLQSLPIPGAVKQDVVNAVNAGKVVTIPEREVPIGSTQVLGYIVEDPVTFSTAYLITGGSAGGLLILTELGFVISVFILGFGVIAGAAAFFAGAFVLAGFAQNLLSIFKNAENLGAEEAVVLVLIAGSIAAITWVLTVTGLFALPLATGVLLSIIGNIWFEFILGALSGG
jgi:hypothetical protein